MIEEYIDLLSQRDALDKKIKSLKSKIINVASYWAGDLDLNDPEFSNRL